MLGPGLSTSVWADTILRRLHANLLMLQYVPSAFSNQPIFAMYLLLPSLTEFFMKMCQFDLRPRWPLGEEYAEGRSEARSMKTARIHPSLTSLIQASVQQQS